MELFEVGGCIRDEILGVKSKDIDFTVVLSNNDVLGHPSPFDAMRCELRRMGFEIFLETPEYFTIRARFPKTGTFGSIHVSPALHGITADFVLARKEGSYSDGRRPDTVQVGTLQDDLARRDFTMNAIAKDAYGSLIDPFNGQADIQRKVIRAVGNARERIIGEDALRGLRALRFAVTKGFNVDSDVVAVLASAEFKHVLRNVSTERVREELDKMFKVDTMKTLNLLRLFDLDRVIFEDTGLRLMPTMKG